MILGLTIPISESATAALVGCPNTWKEPTPDQIRFSSLPLDLNALKQEKPFDVVITRLSDEYAINQSSWMKVGTDYSVIIPLSYAFAGKKARQVWRVEVKGCPDIVNRYYGYSLAELKDPIEKKEITTFFTDQDNRKKFGGPSDFQQNSRLIESFEKCKSEIVANARIYYSELGSNVVWRDGLTQRTSGTCGIVQDITSSIRLFFKDSNCSRIDNGAIRIANGVKCDVFLGLTYYPLFSLSFVNFISLSDFSLEGPIDRTAELEKIAAEKAKLEADRVELNSRRAPGSPFNQLFNEYSELAKSISESVIPKVNSDKVLRTNANLLRSQIIESRDQMGKMLSEVFPRDVFDQLLQQSRKTLEGYLLQKKNLEATALQVTTITCFKSKLTKKVTALKPKCPSGYKVKK